MSVEFEHVAVAKVLGVSELVRMLLTYDCAAKSLLRGLQDFSKSRSGAGALEMVESGTVFQFSIYSIYSIHLNK